MRGSSTQVEGLGLDRCLVRSYLPTDAKKKKKMMVGGAISLVEICLGFNFLSEGGSKSISVRIELDCVFRIL